MITQYNNFIVEGVRDKMTPKSDDDLLKSIKKLSKKEKNNLLYKYTNELDFDMIKFLIENGVDPEVADDNISMLQRYQMHKAKEIRELINAAKERRKPINRIKNFLKFNESVRDQMTPISEDDIRKHVENYTPDQELVIACQRGIVWLAKEAIEKGANYNNWTFISDACRYGQLDIVRYLVEEMGVDIHIKNELPLKNTVINGKTDVAEYLIGKGANVNVEDGTLFYAAWDCMHADICRLLVKKGFDLQSFIKSKPFPIQLKYFVEHHFPNIDVSEFKTKKKEFMEEVFDQRTGIDEAITWDFSKPHSERRYKQHLDAVMNAKVGDILSNEDIFQYIEYLTIQADKFEYSFVDGDLAERIEEYDEYQLKELLLDALDLKEWDIDYDDVEEYRLKYLKGKEYPPIVVDAQYSIIDGIHRANGLKKAGLTKILAFVGIEK